MTATIVLAAGGTGGHMFPAEALARELLARGLKVVLVTDVRGHAFGDALPEVPVERVRAATLGGGLVGKVRMFMELAVGVRQAKALLKRIRPAAVVGFGGYPSLPTVHAAQRLGIPTILHEQNAVLGRANRLLAGKAARICTAFAAVKGLPTRAAVVRTGNPVRPGILALHGAPLPDTDHGLNLLVTGGSQGAAVFSSVVPQAIAMLPDDLRQRLRIVQQARPETMADAHAIYDDIGAEVELSPFFRDMPARLAACHLMICRSGASTVAELAVAGRPAILVPYPHATDDHQTANARAVAEAGGAWIVPQPEFTSQALAERLTRLLTDTAALQKAAAAARAWAMPDAATRLATVVLETAGLAGSNGNHPPMTSGNTWRAAE